MARIALNPPRIFDVSNTQATAATRLRYERILAKQATVKGYIAILHDADGMRCSSRDIL